MDSIGRLRIVCLAGPGRTASALRVRQRLDRVARANLPQTLERIVDPDRRIDLPRLTVRLDLDPLDYDDETLAMLWASRIEEAILAKIGAGAMPAAPEPPTAEDSGEPPVGRSGHDAADATAIVRLAWRLLAGDRRSGLAVARAIVADPARVVGTLRSALSTAERRSLVEALATIAPSTAGAPRSSRTEHRPARSGMGRRPARPEPAVLKGRSWSARLERASRELAAATPTTAPGHRPAPAGERNRRRPGRDQASARETSPDPRLVSHVAGVALLWPWLAGHLEAVADTLRDLNPIDARRVALSALVPDEPGAVDDPVVRLLAGDDLDTEPSIIFVTSGDVALAGDGSSDVLQAFAASLPGFAGSTVAFVRREFLVRPGIVDRTIEPPVVRLAPMPLDPVLARLPYPIAAFRLPWTVTLSMRLEIR